MFSNNKEKRIVRLLAELEERVAELNDKTSRRQERFRKNDVYVVANSLSGLLTQREFDERVAPLLFGTGVRILYEVEPVDTERKSMMKNFKSLLTGFKKR